MSERLNIWLCSCTGQLYLYQQQSPRTPERQNARTLASQPALTPASPTSHLLSPRLPTADCRLPFPVSRFPTAGCWLFLENNKIIPHLLGCSESASKFLADPPPPSLITPIEDVQHFRADNRTGVGTNNAIGSRYTTPNIYSPSHTESPIEREFLSHLTTVANSNINRRSDTLLAFIYRPPNSRHIDPRLNQLKEKTHQYVRYTPWPT